ncbi:hypothetical protein CRUP_018736 [Coryphaenoides rupestris]|nr:hypothetical protein CRUP_018736 [Coryphaenoides rupestris]
MEAGGAGGAVSSASQDLAAIQDEDVLNKMLDAAVDYEERRALRAALRDLLKTKRALCASWTPRWTMRRGERYELLSETYSRLNEGVHIRNFSSSWSDGIAFCALVHRFFPDAFEDDISWDVTDVVLLPVQVPGWVPVPVLPLVPGWVQICCAHNQRSPESGPEALQDLNRRAGPAGPSLPGAHPDPGPQQGPARAGPGSCQAPLASISRPRPSAPCRGPQDPSREKDSHGPLCITVPQGGKCPSQFPTAESAWPHRPCPPSSLKTSIPPPPLPPRSSPPRAETKTPSPGASPDQSNAFRVYIVTWNVGSSVPPDDIRCLFGATALDGSIDMFIVGLQEVNSMINKRLKDALFTDQWSEVFMDTLAPCGYVLVSLQSLHTSCSVLVSLQTFHTSCSVLVSLQTLQTSSSVLVSQQTLQTSSSVLVSLQTLHTSCLLCAGQSADSPDLLICAGQSADLSTPPALVLVQSADFSQTSLIWCWSVSRLSHTSWLCAGSSLQTLTPPPCLGNKGGVSARMTVFGHSVCFLNCHLPAHMDNLEQRVDDFQSILQQQHFDEAIGVLDHDVVFWFGDLNFRIDDYDIHVVKCAVDSHKLPLLWERDQLNMAKNTETILEGFLEGPLNFPPTYKFDVGTNTYDTSTKKRKPAWTDRILWRLRCTGSAVPSHSAALRRGLTSWLGGVTKVTQHDYRSHMELRASDHKPVSAIFSLHFPFRVDVPQVSLQVEAEWSHVTDATVRFSVAASYQRSSWDWVALYKVMFPEEDLPADEGEYIVGYYSHNMTTIVGVAGPVQIRIPVHRRPASPTDSSDLSSEDDSTLVLLSSTSRSPSPKAGGRRHHHHHPHHHPHHPPRSSQRSHSPALPILSSNPLPSLPGLSLSPRPRDGKKERLVSPETLPSPSLSPLSPLSPRSPRSPGGPGGPGSGVVTVPEALVAAILGEHPPAPAGGPAGGPKHTGKHTHGDAST